MNEQTHHKYEDMLDKLEADLANMDPTLAAPFRRALASRQAQATGGLEKWEAISARLREHIGEQNFKHWFSDVTPALIPDSEKQPPHLRLAFPNAFTRNWIEAHFSDYIHALWKSMEPTGTLELAIQPPPPCAARETLPAKAAPPAEKKDEVIPFPPIPDNARPVVNIVARSSLFSAIQGKDRQLVENKKIEADGENKLFYTGRELNQDDHDTFLQLVKMASHQPFGEYVTAPAHAILTGMGRKTGGAQHKQLAGEIDRMTKGSIDIDNPKAHYIGHLIDDAVQDKTKRYWIYRLNPLLAQFYMRDAYTLIDWDGRQKLQGKDLARWLQAYYATHAEPYPVKVETLHRLSGSKNASLRGFRRDLKKALDDLKANGDLSAWRIDERDLVHVDRGDAISASQRHRLDPPQPR